MSIWKQLYQAYEEKNCEKFNQLRKQLSHKEKNSPYFSYYASLKAKLCPQQNKKWKILLKWKTIKCPSCWAPLTLSDYNQEQIKELKNWAKQVIFVCNYCWNRFSYSKTPFKTIFTNYSVWDEINLNWKKYKLAWAVKYKWTYNEIWDSTWSLDYIEWLAYDDKWEIYYISESRAKDSRGTYDELEVSKKINFPFVVNNIYDSDIETDSWNKTVDEIDEVKVTSLIWELNKWYTIWETVKLWKFWNYNLEEEKWNNSIERNLYQDIKKTDINKNNSVKNITSWNDSSLEEAEEKYFYLYILAGSFLLGIGLNIFFQNEFLFITLGVLASLAGLPGEKEKKFNPKLFWPGILFTLWVLASIFLPNYFQYTDYKINYLLLIWALIVSIWLPLTLLAFNPFYKPFKYGLFAFSFTAIFWGVLTYELFGWKPSKLWTQAWWYQTHSIPTGNYEYWFNKQFIYNTQLIRTYDYGGREYKQQILQWLFFSVNNKKDQKMLKYFLNHIWEILHKLKTPVKFYTCINLHSTNKFTCSFKNIDNNWKSLNPRYKINYLTTQKILFDLKKDLIVKYQRWYEKFWFEPW